MFTLENDNLKVTISAKGAELQSIYNKHTKLEYLWSGDPKFWAKKSPVLFPIVGELKNNNYNYNGKTYQMGRHGFARDMEFEVTEQTATSITFTIKDNAETLTKYPFHFKFSVKYAVNLNNVITDYIVENTGKEVMYFSVGGHPAFSVPVAADTSFEDYYLQFSETENAGRWPLSSNGLIETTPEPFLENTDHLALQKSLFYSDALVFKNLTSHFITIKSNKTAHGVSMYYRGFPYTGIWSYKNADFVCIEPWCGIADNVDATGELQNKEGINTLQPSEVFTRSWQAEVF